MPDRQRSVLVTGASRGIGASVCNELVKQGHQVIGLSRTFNDNDSQIHADKSESGNFTGYSLDMEEISGIEPCIKHVIQDHTVDALVCCAGQGKFGSLVEFSTHQIQQLVTVNLLSHLLLCRYLLPTLRTHSRSDIVFIGSENAIQGGRYGAVYSATKAGLRGFAQALQHECSAANCHIGIINPGMTRTSFFENLTFEPGDDASHAIDPQTVANCVLQLLTAPDNSVINEINLNPLKKVVKKKPV